MKNALITVALATATLSFGIAAQAQSAPMGGNPEKMEKLEKAKDELHKRFGTADANVDGFLTKDEAKSKMPWVYKNFDAIDKSHAGKVSMADIESYAMSQRGTRQRGK